MEHFDKIAGKKKNFIVVELQTQVQREGRTIRIQSSDVVVNQRIYRAGRRQLQMCVDQQSWQS